MTEVREKKWKKMKWENIFRSFIIHVDNCGQVHSAPSSQNLDWMTFTTWCCLSGSYINESRINNSINSMEERLFDNSSINNFRLGWGINTLNNGMKSDEKNWFPLKLLNSSKYFSITFSSITFTSIISSTFLSLVTGPTGIHIMASPYSSASLLSGQLSKENLFITAAWGYNLLSRMKNYLDEKIAQCSTVQYSTVQYSTVQYSTVQ